MQPRRAPGYVETYLRALGWGVVAVGAIFGYRAVSDLYDRLIGKKPQPLTEGSEEKNDGYF